MIKNESSSNINGNFYKSKNSISSNLENELIEKNNNNNNGNVGMTHHRKNNLSFFYGSYALDNGLNKLLNEYKDNNYQENVNIENISFEFENNSNKTKSKKDSIINEKEKNINSSNTNLNTNDNEKYIPFSNSSFYSYSMDNEGNQEENNTKEDKSSFDININEKANTILYMNNPYYELEKNKEKYNKEKSFIPITNALKYIKDKDERMTDSYLMALGGGEFIDADEKKNYLPTASIIEEEKSELIESTSKKQNLININSLMADNNLKKGKLFEIIKNKENIMKKDDENKENINNNYMPNKNPNIHFDLNKITIKNSYKEEIKKNYYIKKNNINSIYKNKLLFPLNNKYITKKIKPNENCRNIPHSNYNSNIVKKTKKLIKKNKLYSSKEAISNKTVKIINYNTTDNNNNNTMNTLSLRHHHRFNTEFNLKKIIPKNKYNITELINNTKNNMDSKKYTFNKSLDNKLSSEIKPKVLCNINKKKEKRLCTNKTFKNLSISYNQNKKLKKIIVNIKHNRAISTSNPINKNNYNYNQKNALPENIINNKSESLLLQDNKSKKDINKKSQRLYRQKKMFSISTLPNSCSSRVKLKVNKNFKNNSIFRNILVSADSNKLLCEDFVLNINNDNDICIHVSNINQVENILKQKIKFANNNEKNELFEKIKCINNNNLNTDNYIILCENNINIKELFSFKGFFKYSTEEKKYIKIYGNEKCPNHILLKNVNYDN